MSEAQAVEQLDDKSVDDLDQGLGEATEVEIVLSGQDDTPSSDANKPDPRSHILARMQRRDSKQQDRITELENQLKATASNLTPAVDVMPTLESCEHDNDVHAQKLSEWNARQITNAVSTQLKQQQHGHNLTAQAQQNEQALSKYADHAAKLGVSDFNETQDKAIDVLGEDFAQMLARELPEDSPKLVYWFGKNPTEAAKYRDKYLANAGGATFDLGKLAAQLTVKRKTSNAADPEKTIESGGLASSNGDFKKTHDSIYDDVDKGKLTTSQAIKKVRQLKAEAKAAGYDVSQLK